VGAGDKPNVRRLIPGQMETPSPWQRREKAASRLLLGIG